MFFRTKALTVALALAAPSILGQKFTYDPISDVGPGNWDEIVYADGSNQCGGDENSPVAIEDTGCQVWTDYTLKAGNCNKGNTKFTINDHGVKASFGDDCTKPSMIMPGKPGTWDALQFHIHTGSEHTVDGVTFGAELHIVHARRDCPTGQKRCFAVVGTKLNPASPNNNPLFQTLLEGWLAVHNAQEARCNTKNTFDFKEETTDATLIDPYQFNRQSSFFTYNGGLTTPPCSEAVYWSLDADPLAVSVEQYVRLSQMILQYKNSTCDYATVAHHGSTSRPTQPLGGRRVTKVCPSSAK